MKYKHKLFLTWVVYMVMVVALFGALSIEGIPQFVLAHDKSFFSIGMISLYFLFELFASFKFFSISGEQLKVQQALAFFNNAPAPGILIKDGEVYGLSDRTVSSDPTFKITSKYLKEHILNLVRSGASDQSILIEVLASKLHTISKTGMMRQINMGLGLVGTVVGIVLLFMPFMNTELSGFDMAQIQTQLPLTFLAIGAIFFPTLVASIVDILLIINERNFNSGVTELVEDITLFSEIHVLPHVDKLKPIGVNYASVE